MGMMSFDPSSYSGFGGEWRRSQILPSIAPRFQLHRSGSFHWHRFTKNHIISSEMVIDFDSLSPGQAYSLMIQCIIPRPIAWILSDNGDTTYNLAPFSYFNGVTGKPPIISVSIGTKRDGAKKDTWVNIEERKHFVVHIPSKEHAQTVSRTSAPLEFGQSEITANDLEVVQQTGWPTPRLKTAQVALLCEKHLIIEVGDGPQGLLLGRVTEAYIKDELVDIDDGQAKILAAKLNPLARLGGDDYTDVDSSFTVPRPG
jgi:flavin reductase (DIM6/NTAB) family NADH-FMN oxidoreductase RutF